MVHITRPDENPAVLGAPQTSKQAEPGSDARGRGAEAARRTRSMAYGSAAF